MVIKYMYHLGRKIDKTVHCKTLPKFTQNWDFWFESIPSVATRVARWFVFKPKIPNLGKFWRALEW
jgi:hypothetical protein